MGSNSYTLSVPITIPAGRFCSAHHRQCRFFQEMGHHPGYFCFLIPESIWERKGWDCNYEKHPKCPGLKSSAKPMKGESDAVMKRLEAFKKAQETETVSELLLDDENLANENANYDIQARSWDKFCPDCHSPMFHRWKFCPMCGGKFDE